MVEHDSNIEVTTKQQIRNKIIIYEGFLNNIGNHKFAFSKRWYQNLKPKDVKRIRGNIYNYFHHILGSGSEANLWTTYKEYEPKLKGDRYSRGFIPCNTRSTNEYRNKESLAYCVNRFVKPYIVQFFKDRGVEVDNDSFALSEMIQWVWRSGIRDHKPINIYIPSSRMRNLLKDWLSVTLFKNVGTELFEPEQGAEPLDNL